MPQMDRCSRAHGQFLAQLADTLRPSEGFVKLARTAFAVLDVETTGFVPGTHRIVEVGAVLVAPDRTLRVGLDTITRAPGAAATFPIHRIPAARIQAAPRFGQVAGTLLRCMAGRVVVGHNLTFDLRHLRSEFDRLGVELPALATLDTMWLDHRLTGKGRRTLSDACAAHGIRREQAHAAGADAVDTARLLVHLLALAETRGLHSLPELDRWLGRSTQPLLPPSMGERLPAAAVPVESRYGEMLEGRVALQEYGQQLAMVLADTSLTAEEARALRAFREARGLHTEQVRAMHAQVFAAAILLFCQDGRIDEAEAGYLHRLRQALAEAGWAPGDLRPMPQPALAAHA